MEPICRGAILNGFIPSRSSSFSPAIRHLNLKRLKSKNSIQPSSNFKPKAPLKRKELAYRSPSKKPPPPLNAPRKPREKPFQYRTVPIVVCGITLLGLSGLLSYTYIGLTRATPTTSSAFEQADVSSRYDQIADSFDNEVDWNERILGINRMRQTLVNEAKGDVLEVSIGTGRNLDKYKWSFGQDKGLVKSFTAIDKSVEMLEVAHEKFGKLFPVRIGVRWVVGDASEPGAIPPPPQNSNGLSENKFGEKYDSVVQTMGLCSVDDPVKLLKTLGGVVKEEDGRILLLEHGRGRWGWLNNILDKTAKSHAEKFGCWYNRDLEKIVEESGLDVVKAKSYWLHGGTTWAFELKKPRSTLVREELKDTGNKGRSGVRTPDTASSWRRWLWS